MSNCDVSFRCDPTIDEFIDVVEGGRVYIPVVYVLNKIDAISIEELGECSLSLAVGAAECKRGGGRRAEGGVGRDEVGSKDEN